MFWRCLLGIYIAGVEFNWCSNAERTTVAADGNFGSCRIQTWSAAGLFCWLTVITVLHRSSRKKSKTNTQTLVLKSKTGAELIVWHWSIIKNSESVNKGWNIVFVFFFNVVFFSFMHVKYTPYVRRVPGNPTVHQAEKQHCTVAAFLRLILLKIGFRYDSSRRTQASFMHRHVYVSALSRLTYYYFISILNVPYKKRLLTCTFSPSQSTVCRPRAADGASLAGGLWENNYLLLFAFRL